MADHDDTDNEANGDAGWWDCGLCTYRNSAEKFKCEMCYLRRGTSTRKPRCNADTVVALVVKQQEQIRQQTVVKPIKSRSSVPAAQAGSTSGLTTATPSSSAANGHGSTSSSLTPQKSSSKSATKSTSKSSSSTSSSSKSRPRPYPRDSDDLSDTSDSTQHKKKKPALTDSNSNKTKSSSNKTTGNPVGTSGTSSSKQRTDAQSRDLEDNGASKSDSECTDISEHSSSPPMQRSASRTSCDSSPYSSSEAISPELAAPTSVAPTTTNLSDNPYKIKLEVKGNLIKYSPPTLSGRTGITIDRKRFSQHSVTVNDVTITFTEFKTRQNLYVRKKKRRRDGKAKSATATNANPNSNNNGASDNNNNNSCSNTKNKNKSELIDAT